MIVLALCAVLGAVLAVALCCAARDGDTEQGCPSCDEDMPRDVCARTQLRCGHHSRPHSCDWCGGSPRLP